MKRRTRGTLGALLAAAVALTIAMPAGATTSGNESFDGVIVASSSSGTRTVVTSVCGR